MKKRSKAKPVNKSTVDENSSGGILRAARNASKLTQEQLGDLVDVSKGLVSKLEKGDQEMTVAYAKLFAPHVGLRPIDFFPDLGGKSRGVDLVARGLSKQSMAQLDAFYETLLKAQGGAQEEE